MLENIKKYLPNVDVDNILPFTDPVPVFAIILIIMLVMPMILEKIKIPGIVGLIFAGIIVGPHAFNILRSDSGSAIELFGNVGLLYIMFLSGLETDPNDLNKSKVKSITFGLLTFLIPQVLGCVIVYFTIKSGQNMYDMRSSILLASMFASHTLIAYPLLSKFGIAKKEYITVTVGGTMITNFLALFVLSIISSSAKGTLDFSFWIRLFISLVIYMLFIFLFVPAVCRKFFKSTASDNDAGYQFIFVLVVVFISSYLAKLAGIEPIIGAFLAGIVLNKFVISTSALMNRVVFVGNTIFVPFFLIMVGMLVNVKVLFSGYSTWLVGGIMIATLFLTKWLAAIITKVIFKYSMPAANIMFGLSLAQAAGTLAAVMIGYKLGILNDDVLNGTILMILVSCIFSSIIVDKSGKILSEESDDGGDLNSERAEQLLIPIINLPKKDDMNIILDLSFMLGGKTPKEVINTTALIPNSPTAQNQIKEYDKITEEILKKASGADKTIKSSARIEKDIGVAIQKIVKESFITHILLQWDSGFSEKKNFIKASVLDNILDSTTSQLTIINFVEENDITKIMTSLKKIIVSLPEFIHLETGFRNMVRIIKTLAKELKLPVEFYCSKKTAKYLTRIIDLIKPDITYIFNEIDTDKFGTSNLKEILTKEILYVPVFTRKGTISWNKYTSNGIQRVVNTFKEINIIAMYPEVTDKNSKPTLDILQGGISKNSFFSYGSSTQQPSGIKERFSNLKNSVTSLFKKDE